MAKGRRLPAPDFQRTVFVKRRGRIPPRWAPCPPPVPCVWKRNYNTWQCRYLDNLSLGKLLQWVGVGGWGCCCCAPLSISALVPRATMPAPNWGGRDALLLLSDKFKQTSVTRSSGFGGEAAVKSQACEAWNLHLISNQGNLLCVLSFCASGPFTSP